MQKVRINEIGFEHYTGLLGMIPFTNGISDRPLTPEEMARLGATCRVIGIESGLQVGAGVELVKLETLTAPEPAPKPEPKPAPKILEYSKDRLEEIASEGGIKAVRDIAAKYNVKGVQISALIDGIIEAQLKG